MYDWETRLFDKYNGEDHETLEEEFWDTVYETESLPSRYWEPGCEEVYVLPEDQWVPDDVELPFA